MRLFGLIGYPLTHSFSKNFFSRKFEEENRNDCRYENFPIRAIRMLPGLLQQYPALAGLNITIPFKKSVIYYLNEATDVVRTIGACNCVTVINNKLTGYNTDVIGFRESLQKNLKQHHTRALVLGTGGAAAAVTYALKEMHIPCTCVSTHPTVHSIPYAAVNEKIIATHPIIINTTPLGMFPDVVSCPDIPYQFITPEHLLFDLVYNPDETLFLKKGNEKGAATMNGFEMLRIQAEESWKIWNSELK